MSLPHVKTTSGLLLPKGRSHYDSACCKTLQSCYATQHLLDVPCVLLLPPCLPCPHLSKRKRAAAQAKGWEDSSVDKENAVQV